MQQSLEFAMNTPKSLSIYKGDKWDSVWETLKNDDDLNSLDASRGVSLAGLITSSANAIYKALTDGWICSLAYSSGKDSECVLHLFLTALTRAVRSGRKISQHHFILHCDTQIENPEVRYLADKKLATLEAFIKSENLPLTIVLAKPGLTSSWTGRVLTGRGLPTFSNSSARQCSNELKISSSRRAKAAYLKSIPKDSRAGVCLLLGSRDAEGVIRANNIAKQGGSAAKVVATKEGGELYPVRHWLQGDVWEYLLCSGSTSQYCLPSYLENNVETAEMYKSATGECVFSGSEKKTSEACGSRFGCWACQAVGLDKSMEAMISNDKDKYGYMSGLNRIQRFLSKRRNAWEDRHPVGRTLYGDGYVKIQPDVYSPRFLERLLHICCSMDYAEQCRADGLALKLIAGEVEDNSWNRRMSEPQFRIVSEIAIVHIDFMWSFHHFNDKPFHALEIYRRVWASGQLDLLEDEPSIPVAPKLPIPKPIWVKVGSFTDGSIVDGLTDPIGEMVYFDPESDERAGRGIKTPQGMRRVVSFSESDEIRIDNDAAAFIIWEEYPRLRRAVLNGEYTSGRAAQFYLRFGAIEICKGKSALYHRMMQRGQTYQRMGLSGFQTMEGIAARKDLQTRTHSKFQYVVRRKMEASLVRFKWWSVMAFTVNYHLYHRSELGGWIVKMLESNDKKI